MSCTITDEDPTCGVEDVNTRQGCTGNQLRIDPSHATKLFTRNLWQGRGIPNKYGTLQYTNRTRTASWNTTKKFLHPAG
ncbi:hypothetical protein PR048_027184 [Dryococelus australis]|uniref:Uncharacterized protein n=1 Tax=Dryococelus australis TaxID=614101 RepID=A0ABQ9GGB1_9NEOP|nr:hypothetical protein PR048_027184 [Dryococelus australis]